MSSQNTTTTTNTIHQAAPAKQADAKSKEPAVKKWNPQENEKQTNKHECPPHSCEKGPSPVKHENPHRPLNTAYQQLLSQPILGIATKQTKFTIK